MLPGSTDTQGATSIWERWNGYTNELGFNGNNSMNSFNHYSLGAVYEWMVAYQLGIKSDETQPGYQHFILQPTVGGDFTEAEGSYDSVYGTIKSGWTAADGVMTSYDVTVPGARPPQPCACQYLVRSLHATA